MTKPTYTRKPDLIERLLDADEDKKVYWMKRICRRAQRRRREDTRLYHDWRWYNLQKRNI